ncbi:c-type cytochrome [Gluconacetobacter entanii]|uniref:Alcohol dehydrogenase n=1 Tax=Gluconacetobacter entanii TaxID=108528 RepID=A0A318PVS5_9PROT|nr:cytochrome c [Gluconacetobacter entanii]MCE2577001.1 cytochrome c [Komagataeibacter sp. FNDCR1]PYD64610.1 alcohol dehydrogenase [Gluconacetobacter entanii]
MKGGRVLALLLGLAGWGTAPARAADDAGEQAQVAAGEYVARAADCSACHSLPGGKPFAGGLAFHLPMGTIRASNITPDPKAGIGSYSEAEFARAVRQGIRRDGATLYPAMPYPSYAHMTDADVHALYVYFMKGVAPVATPVAPNDIVWPLSMRWPLVAWRMMFAPSGAQGVRTFADPQLARGAYLVEGPGHCGACHTPRGIAMQEKALTAVDGPLYLSGGSAVDGWNPVSLRGEMREGLGRWSEEDIVTFLQTGRVMHAAAFGGMTDAIRHGTQHLSDDDLRAIAHYLKSLPPAHPQARAWQYDETTGRTLHAGDLSARGARAYVDNCAACHRTDGRGYPTTFPPLAGNPVVMDASATSLIRIVLTGSVLRATHQAPSAFVMPGFAARMDDRAVADVVSFIRQSWGNDVPQVSAAEVAEVRRSLKGSGDAPPARQPLN